MTAPAQVPHRFSGAALLFLAPVLLLLVFSARQVGDCDTWWHLKTGEFIATQHQIPRTDPFSLVNEGKPWVNFEWLSQLAFYLVYRLGGPRGLVLGKTIILGSAFLLFAFAGLELKKPLLSSALLALSVITASERFMERPEIFSYLLLGAFVFILHRYRQGQFDRLIFILPVLQVLWENLHGGTLLGIETVGAYAVGQTLLRLRFWPSALRGWKEPVMDTVRYRRLLLVAGLVVLATLLNPWGPQTLWIIFRTQSHQWTMANIAEWQRTYAMTPPLPPDVIAYWAWLAVAGLGFLLNFRRVDLNHLFLALGFLLISLLAQRNIALFALVALPITARNFFLAGQDLRLSARLAKLKSFAGLKPAARAATMAGLAGFCLWLSWFVATDRYYLASRSLVRFGWNLSTLVYPWPMLDFLAQSGIQGPLFNDHDLGGYLIWRDWPTYRVFLDSRAFIYDPDFMTDYSRALHEAPAWKALCDRYQFRLAAILHPSQGLVNLLSILAHDPDWTPVYLDETGVIFARNLPENAEWIARHRLDLADAHSLTFTAPSRARPRRLGWFTAPPDPMQVANAAIFFEKVEQYDPAVTLLQQTLQLDPGNPRIMSDLAGVEVMRRRWSEAETWSRRAVAGDPSLTEAWLHLGDAFFSQERLSEAVWAYSQALSLDPKRYAALENRGVALGRLKRFPEAKADLEEALGVQADHPRPWCNLAFIYDQARDQRAAFVWSKCLAGLIRDGGDPQEIARVRARLEREAP